MEIVVAQQAGRIPVTVFHITGDIDSSTSQQVQTRIEEEIKTGAPDIVLDLTTVGYVSSAGIRLLGHLFKLLRGNLPQESDAAMSQGIRAGTFKSPHLKLAGPTPRVANVLKMSGTDMIIESYRDVPEAVASF